MAHSSPCSYLQNSPPFLTNDDIKILLFLSQITNLLSFAVDPRIMLPLKGLVPAATNTVNTEFIVLDKSNIIQNGKETTCLSLVADETASVYFQMRGRECDAFEPGDIVRLNNGIFSYHKNNLMLRAGKKGKAEKIGEFTMVFVETPNMSEIQWSRDPNNPKKFVKEGVASSHLRIFTPLP